RPARAGGGAAPGPAGRGPGQDKAGVGGQAHHRRKREPAFRWCVRLCGHEPYARRAEGAQAARRFVTAGVEPDEMGVGPVAAVPRLLERHGSKIDDIDLWELNEAYAVQVIYCRDKLGTDPERLNVNGGSRFHGPPPTAVSGR